MRKIILLVIILSSGISFGQPSIVWTDDFSEDLSFTKNWHYPEGVYVNRHGQLSCDGLCPPEIDAMKDSDGRLIEDSLIAFYAIVDTTHIYSTISNSADVNEFNWGGTKETETICTQEGDSVSLKTLYGVSTHSTLNLQIIEGDRNPGKVKAKIIYISIRPVPTAIYRCIGGVIEISAPDFDTNLLKAKFDLIFESAPENPEPIKWSGVICAPIIETKEH
jgi:hypothetical protein